MTKSPSRTVKRSSRAKSGAQTKQKRAASAKPRENLQKRANWFQQRTGSKI